jgi:hypothetical protein
MPMLGKTEKEMLLVRMLLRVFFSIPKARPIRYARIRKTTQIKATKAMIAPQIKYMLAELS